MKKMPCAFVRDFTNKQRPIITPELSPGLGWVASGDFVATVKWDGTACAVIGGVLHRRYDAKRGKTPPAIAIPCDTFPDHETGHWPHWLPVGNDAQDKWHRLAWIAAGSKLHDGTYELCGPHFQANPHRLPDDVFIPHGKDIVRTENERAANLEYWRDLMSDYPHEGVVLYEIAGGGRCKIRRADFGFAWPLADLDKGDA